MAPKFHVLVIGGGIGGFACAVGLARKGHAVTVLERSASLQTWGGGLLISSNALRVIESYGLLGRFQEVAEKWERHVIFRYDGGVLDVLSNAANEKVFGYEMLNVRRQVYQRVLYEGAVEQGVKVRFGCRVEKIDDSEKGPSVMLSTGETLLADLIVGADGIKSTTRPFILGGRDVKLQPNSTCYQCTIPASLMLSSPLTAPLINERAIHSWWGPNTHWICGRKSNGQSYDAAFFIHPTASSPLPASHVSASNSHDPGKGKDNDRRGDVREVIDGVQTHGYEERVQAFAKMIPHENCTLWKVAQLPDLPTWVSESGRIVLLGDAAHAMSPHLGQGAAMTIEDGGVLSECLARASSLDDIPRAVKVYEEIQKGRTEKVKRAAGVSGVWKTMADGPEQRKRDEGFRKRMESGEKYEFWRASGHLAWIYGWDSKLEVGKELDRVFPVGKGIGQRARI